MIDTRSEELRLLSKAPADGPDLKLAYRYDAACFAAVGAAGRGQDAAKLDDKERTCLRKQALDWLRADLAAWTKQMENGQPDAVSDAKRTLGEWQQDSDLTGIRDAAALARLPAEERPVFTQFWADIAALLKKVEAKP